MRIGCNEGIALALSLSTSIKPFGYGSPAPVRLRGRGGPSNSLSRCVGDTILGRCRRSDTPIATAPVVRCGGGGKLTLGPPLGVHCPARGGPDIDVLSPALALLCWLVPESLDLVSKAGFFGMGGAGFLITLEVVDFVDT